MTGQAELHALLAEADRLAIGRLVFEPRVNSLRGQIAALQGQLDAVLEERRTGDEAFEAIGRQIEVYGVDRDTLEKLVESRMALLSGVIIPPTAVVTAAPVSSDAQPKAVVPVQAPVPSEPPAARPAAVEPETETSEQAAAKPERSRRSRPAPVVEASPASASEPAAVPASAPQAETIAPSQPADVIEPAPIEHSAVNEMVEDKAADADPTEFAPLVDDREPEAPEPVLDGNRADEANDVLDPFDPSHAAASEVITAAPAKEEADFIPSFMSEPAAAPAIAEAAKEPEFVPGFKAQPSGDDFLPPFLQGN